MEMEIFAVKNSGDCLEVMYRSPKYANQLLAAPLSFFPVATPFLFFYYYLLFTHTAINNFDNLFE